MNHRIAMVGFGGMAMWHCKIIDKIENLKIAGIWDVKEERRNLAKEKNIHVYESLEDLLSDNTVDLVLVATPNDVHKEIVIQAMELGKHVVCEKPVTISSIDLQEMMDASKRTGKFFTVHQNRRWDTDFRMVKKILEEGKLGEIHRIESRVHGSRGIPGDWRQEKEKGGGMILDWGVHLLDQALLFYSEAKVESVYATITNVTNQLVDDGFHIDIKLDNDIHIITEVGTSNFISLPRWYVLGANGTAIIEDWSLKGKIICATGENEKDILPVVTAAGLTKTMAPRREDNICSEELPKVVSNVGEFYENVMAVIEGKEEPKISLDEVMRVMKLMEAAFESARLGQVVSFEDSMVKN